MQPSAPSATLIHRGQRFQVAADQTLEQALRTAGLHPENYLAVRLGELIPMTTQLNPGDEVKLVSVIAGG